MEYLLKSILCLLVMLLIHRVLLQREVLHRFNRFYLMIAVVSSFLIPLLTIEIPSEENQIFMEEVAEAESGNDTNLEVSNSVEFDQIVPLEPELNTISESTFPWKEFIWPTYLLICGIFLIRFLRNVQVLRNKIRINPHFLYRGETLVLHSENQSPFSFLKYIFISTPSFEWEGIPDAVFAHEQCHVREKHSWDILLIEALLIPFWFHPGLHFAKHSIRLNHEFIADQAALNITSIKDYQQLLLNILLAKPTQFLASNLNFSLTKKRMQMMKKNLGGPFKWVKLAMLLPLLSGIIYFFSNKVVAQGDLPVQKISQPVRIPQTQQAFPTSEYSIADLVNKTDAYPNYIQIKNEYISKLDAGVHFIQKSGPEQEQLLALFTDLFGRYFRLSESEKRNAGRPKHPFAPYSRFEFDGKIVYKLWDDLSESERKQLPPPPIEMKSQELAAYDRELNIYELNRNAGEHFIKKPSWKQELSMNYYQKIQKRYAFLTLAEKQQTSFPTHPFSPYVRIAKEGLTSFKLVKDLTEEEMKFLGC